MSALALGLACALAGLGWRLVELQVVRHAEFRAKAAEKHLRTRELAARRGDIRDVNGEALATSRPVREVGADPHYAAGYERPLAGLLAPLLRTNAAALAGLLGRRWRTNAAGQVSSNRYVTLAERVPLETWLQIETLVRSNRFGFPEGRLGRAAGERLAELRQAVRTEGGDQYIREYPNATLAAAVIGHLNAAGVGQAGIEALCDARLAGADGWQRFAIDRRGRRVPDPAAHELPAQPGDNVHLTLDAGLQLITERELARAAAEHGSRRAAAVLVQPATGRVLAMANWPPFDPALPLVSTNELELRRNHVVNDAYEPGSTLKIVALAAALDAGVVTLRDVFHCEDGHWSLDRFSLRDDQGHRHGRLTVEEILAKSSNIGTYKVALRLGPERFAAALRDFGFLQPTGVNFPRETRGLVAPAPWKPVEFSRICIGYTVTVTPLQLAMAFGALANDGRLMRPLLIDRIENAAGEVLVRAEPQVVRQICRPEVAAQLRHVLRRVVTEGTGAKAALDRYSVAGKTGTAQKIPYRANGHHSSFAGFFPVDEPQLCLVVVFDQPPGARAYYGGVVAAPAFRAIASQAAAYLGLPPDLPPPDDGPSAVIRTRHQSQR